MGLIIKSYKICWFKNNVRNTKKIMAYDSWLMNSILQKRLPYCAPPQHLMQIEY